MYYYFNPVITDVQTIGARAVYTNYYQQLSKVTALVISIVHKEPRNMIDVRGVVLFYAFFKIPVAIL